MGISRSLKDLLVILPWILSIVIFATGIILINVILYIGYFFTFLSDKFIFIHEGEKNGN